MRSGGIGGKITKLTFEDPPIIMKGFSVYICGDDDDDLAQLELKIQAVPLPVRPPEFHDHCFCQISLATISLSNDTMKSS
jgi:hypothetical protein